MANVFIETEHDEYKKYLAPWQLASDAYFGEGGFSDGGYLNPHAREMENDEPTDKFKRRKASAYNLNFCHPVIQQKLGHLFKKSVARKTEDQEIAQFIQNVDGAGATLAEFMERVAEYSMLFGHVWVFVDRPSSKELKAIEAQGLPVSKADEANAGVFPYAYIKDPVEVIDWDKGRDGNLLWVKVRELRPTYDGADGDPFVERTQESFIRTWTRTSMTLHDADGELIDQEDHNLGRVPCVVVYGNRGKNNELSGRSEIHHIAPLQKRLYNLQSELDELLRNQALSILAYPVAEGSTPTDIRIGTDMALPYSATGSPPAYISADASHAASYETRIEKLIREISRLGGLRMEQGVLPSGVAYAYDFESLNNQLTKKAGALSRGELGIVTLMKAWQSADSTAAEGVDYSAAYPESFHVADAAQEVKTSRDAQELNFGSEFWKQYRKDRTRKLLPHLVEEDYAAIDAELEAMADREKATPEIDPVTGLPLEGVSDHTPGKVASINSLRQQNG